MSYLCHDCNEDLENKVTWENLGEIVECKCGAKYEVEYEEDYDGGYFYIVHI